MGASALDFKFEGTAALELPTACGVLQPLADALVALAHRTLRGGENLAVIQLLPNHFQDGGDAVKNHKHRCRQICLSLGADRELSVEGRISVM